MKRNGLTITVTALAALVLVAGCAAHTGAGAADPPEDQLVLFDGGSMQGWEQVGPGRFVEQPDGSMVSEGGMGLLYYAERPFRDFVLELEYRAESRQANSGIFVRFPERPADPWDAVRDGYEIQIDDSQRDPLHATGAVYTFSAPFRLASRPPGEWNQYRIEVTGQRYQIYLNGEKVNDFFGDRGREGYIGLQNHDANSRVHFRNLRVTPLEVADAPLSIGELFAVPERVEPIRVLMLTATHGWRHHEGIAAAKALMRDLSRNTELQVEVTEELEVLTPSNLAGYDLLFFAHSTLRAAPHQPQGADVGDTYTISLHTPQGVRTGNLHVAGEPGRLSGHVTLGGTQLPLEELAYADRRLTLAFTHPQAGRVQGTVRTLGMGLEGTVSAGGTEMTLTGNRYQGAGRHLGGYTPVSEAQRQAILSFVDAGKGIVVVHGGLDAFPDWTDYRELVGGGLFQEHPWVQPVRINVEEPADPTVAHFGDGFWIRDEIYVLDQNPRRNSRVLLTLDMPSVGREQGAPGAATNDYPISWTRSHGNARVFVTSLGHFPDVWGTPDFVRHLLRGMRVAAGRPAAASGS